MGGFDRAGGARRAGRAGKSFQVERDDQGFAFYPGIGDVRRVRCEQAPRAVRERVRRSRKQSWLQTAAQGGNARRLLSKRLPGKRIGLALVYKSHPTYRAA